MQEISAALFFRCGSPRERTSVAGGYASGESVPTTAAGPGRGPAIWCIISSSSGKLQHEHKYHTGAALYTLVVTNGSASGGTVRKKAARKQQVEASEWRGFSAL